MGNSKKEPLGRPWPKKPNGKPYHLVAPEHFSPSTKGGLCGILTVGMLATPFLAVWGAVEAVQAII